MSKMDGKITNDFQIPINRSAIPAVSSFTINCGKCYLL